MFHFRQVCSTLTKLHFSITTHVRALSLLTRLRQRGLIQDITGPELEASLEKPLVFYCGFDPTAPSLHVGNLLLLMSMIHLGRAGHAAVAVVGGATGRIGDPSGKKEE